ncbi:OmpA family protein [Humitalea sp. 24SJ18S-53]|uniref:OmpA family protein n=1 Tax=Humitalea sp. 24SJ18S-53 TaxID=3422307 RepID=UPI003D66848B
MFRALLLASAALYGLAALPAAAPAMAQTDPAALDLINRLRPSTGGSTTRGIRMPGSDVGTAAPAAPVVPAQSTTPEYIQQLNPDGGTRGIRMPGTDTGTSTPPAAVAPPPPRAAAASPRPAAPPSEIRETTAPAGVAAASLTVNFPSGSATLSPAAIAAIAPLGRALNDPALAPFRFRIEGHTDTVGDSALNAALSKRRAEAVRDYLIRQYNVAPVRLEAVGLGESQLLIATPDQVPEQRNRRVQVLNLGS